MGVIKNCTESSINILHYKVLTIANYSISTRKRVISEICTLRLCDMLKGQTRFMIAYW